MRWSIPQMLSDPASASSSHDPERMGRNQVGGPGSEEDAVPKALKAIG